MWTMAQVARALTDAGGGPQTLRSLQVQFRGAGRIGEEVVVSGVVGEVDRERAIVSSQVTQGGRRIIRNAVAELRIR
jgi:hypothetical protein